MEPDRKLKASLIGLAEIEPDVKFLLKEFGTAVSVDQIFGRVAMGGNAKAYRAALKRGAQISDPLAMRMIERFGNAQQCGEAARDPLLGVR